MAEQAIEIGTQGEELSQGIITYPGVAGGLQPLGVGKTFLDLLTGTVRKYDGTQDQLSASLPAFGAQAARSMAFFSDADLNFRFRLGSSFGPLIGYQQLSDVKYHVPFDGIEITLAEAANVFFQAFTDPDPTDVISPNGFLLRYATGSTVNAFTPLNWQSFFGNLLSNSGASYLLNYFTAHALKTKTVIIFNTDSANSLDADLQGQNFPDANWADDASTGTSISITAGNSSVLNVSALYTQMRLRLRSTTAGSAAKFVVQIVGTTT